MQGWNPQKPAKQDENDSTILSQHPYILCYFVNYGLCLVHERVVEVSGWVVLGVHIVIGSKLEVQRPCATQSVAANFSKMHIFRMKPIFSTVYNILALFSHIYCYIHIYMQKQYDNKVVFVPWKLPSFSSLEIAQLFVTCNSGQCLFDQSALALY